MLVTMEFESSAAMASSYQTSSTSQEKGALLTQVPIHIVTQQSQLPAGFLEPSPERQLTIGFDCEGVTLCRHGRLCLMQIAFPDAIYLVDAIEGGDALIKACKPALESSYITKVIHDCKRDGEALYYQFGITLNNVFDTQIAYSLIKEQEGHKRETKDYISIVGLLAEYLDISFTEKEDVHALLRKDPNFWEHRPLSDQMIHAAAEDVRYLQSVHDKMVEKLSQRSLWNLRVRSALYCRCYCISDNNYADRPPLPPFPDDLNAEGNAPVEEIISVLNVPPGKTGYIIGRRGSSILSIKARCEADIFFGGSRGPLDKAFVIGAREEVRKAEAVLREYF